MANLVMNDKALARLHEPDMRMGRYYPPNNSLLQFLQAMQLCVEAIDSMPRRTGVEPLYGGATSHSSVLHIVAVSRPSHYIKINDFYREIPVSAADPFETFGYGFKLPISGHWQSGNIRRPIKCESMLDISKLRLQTAIE